MNLLVTSSKRRNISAIGASAITTSLKYAGDLVRNSTAASLTVTMSGTGVVSGTIVTSFWTMPRIRTARIGPILHIATIPKLSDCEPLLPPSEARPMPSAIMNGTVIGPVVTPPESNETGIKSGLYTATTAVSANTTP